MIQLVIYCPTKYCNNITISYLHKNSHSAYTTQQPQSVVVQTYVDVTKWVLMSAILFFVALCMLSAMCVKFSNNKKQKIKISERETIEGAKSVDESKVWNANSLQILKIGLVLFDAYTDFGKLCLFCCCYVTYL